MGNRKKALPFEDIEGALVVLKPTKPSQALANELEKTPKMCEHIGLVGEAPDLEDLQEIYRNHTLQIWIITQNAKKVGYYFLVRYDGPPFFAIWLTADNAPQRDIEKDCLEQLVPRFFEHLDESSLFLYLDRPVDPETHELLMDAGFDPFDTNPTIDNGRVACYVLERYTYDAYYGEEGEFDEDDSDY